MALQDLRKNDMMAHLLDALEQGKDIGHYARLVFTMVAQYFLDDQEIVNLLKRDQDFSEEQARGLVEQVRSPGYNRRGASGSWNGRRSRSFPSARATIPTRATSIAI
jgi:hypothetical protein